MPAQARDPTDEGGRHREQLIAPDVRALRERLRAGELPALDDYGRPATQPNSLREARAARRELYTLLAVCAGYVVPDFVEANPAGAVRSLRVHSGAPLSPALHDELLAAIEQFFRDHPSRWRGGTEPSPIAPLLERIDEIGPSSSGVNDQPGFHYAESLILTGMRSMVPFAPALLAAIIELEVAAGSPPDAAAVATTASRSVGVLRQLAAVSLEHRSLAERRMIDADSLECFPGAPLRLAGRPGRARLEIELERLLEPGEKLLWPLPPSYAFTIGCPALLKAEREAPLDRLWAWMVDAALQSGFIAARTASALSTDLTTERSR